MRPVLQQRVMFSKVVTYNPGLVFLRVFYNLWTVHFIILPCRRVYFGALIMAYRACRPHFVPKSTNCLAIFRFGANRFVSLK